MRPVLIPMLSLSIMHALMNDLRRGLNPDNHEGGVFLSELFLQAFDVVHIADLAGKGGIDQHLVLIIQSFQSQIHNTVILVIADVVLEELAAAVVGLIRHFENLLGKGDERILIQIYYMLQTCCKCF